MLQRADFYSLQEKLEEKKISIIEISKNADRAIDFLNSCELSEDISIKRKWVISAEEHIKEVINEVLIKINPYTNELVRLDDKVQDTYKNFKFRMENFLGNLNKKRNEIIEKISLKKSEEAEMANNMNMDSFVIFLSSILNNLVLKVLRESVIRLDSVENPSIKINLNKQDVVVDLKELEENDKSQLFWYYVYCYIAELSQTNMALFTIDKFNLRPVDINDLSRVTGGAMGKPIERFSRDTGSKEKPSENPEEEPQDEPEEEPQDEPEEELEITTEVEG